jgi:CubicO group peptidase (beta-lactamase class C family)
MTELSIPGAVVVWVRDGKVSYAAGYGLANRETGTAIDVEATVFRVASVSKFFTALCALRLAEDGKLDLEADVNEYVPVLHVGTAALGRVTPSSLIVHTGGFDERLLGYLTFYEGPLFVK